MKRTRSTILLLIALCVPAAFAAEDDLTDWKARLASEDQKVQDEALKDWINGNIARDADADVIVPLFQPFIRNYAVKRDDTAMTGLVIEYMSRRYGPKAKAAIPDLIKLALDDTATFYIRGQAIQGLGYIAEKDPDVIAALIKVLENPKPTSVSGVHNSAAEVLGNMGAAAESARPALIKLLDHEFKIHQDAAYIALGRIAEDHLALPLMEQIERLAKTKELSVSESSAAFLAVATAGENKNPQAKIALPVLERIIAEESNTQSQRAAIRTVITIGPGSEPSMVRALLKATLKDRQTYAPRALRAVEATNPAAVEPLVEALKEYWDSSNWTDSYYISHTLERYGENARPATPWLIKALIGIERITAPGDAYTSQAQTFLAVLANAGAHDPETLPAVLSVMSPESALRKNSGKLADPVYCNLLTTLAAIGIPKDGPLRVAALERIVEGLESDDEQIFACATLPAGESASVEMIPLLMRVLDENAKFKNSGDDFSRRRYSADLHSLKALEKLGPLASDALPKVSEIAARDLPERSFDFKVNHTIDLIEQARKTKAAIENQ